MILADSCSTGATPGRRHLHAAGGVRTADHRAAPDPAPAGSNAASTPDSIPVTGTGTGGVAAVGPTNADNGFPDWYRDENGITIAQCLDPNDPNCIVPPSEFFDGVNPISFPNNFPDEFFYQLATSDNVTTPGCNGVRAGRALLRTGVEGAFLNGGPGPGRPDDVRPDPDDGHRRALPGPGLLLRHPVRHDHADGQCQRRHRPQPRHRGRRLHFVAPDTCDFTSRCRAGCSAASCAGTRRWPRPPRPATSVTP